MMKRLIQPDTNTKKSAGRGPGAARILYGVLIALCWLAGAGCSRRAGLGVRSASESSASPSSVSSAVSAPAASIAPAAPSPADAASSSALAANPVFHSGPLQPGAESGESVRAHLPPIAAPASPAAPSPSPTAEQDSNPVVLDVNGVRVRRDEYEEGYKDFIRRGGDLDPSADPAAVYRRQLIETLLLYDYGRRIGARGEAEYRRQWERHERELMADYIRRTRILVQVHVTSEDVMRYYDEHRQEFTLPARVQVRAIQAQDLRTAEDLHRRLEEEPERFGEFARQSSLHPSKSKGGELDPFPRGTYAPSFEAAAFSLPIGQISPVIVTDQGYFILEKIGEIPEQRQALSEVQPLIRERVRLLKEREAQDLFLQRLKADSPPNP